MSEDIEYLSLFRMPTPMKITGRSSSITNAFINSIIPIIEPSGAQVKQALQILGMTADNFQCSYCGATATEWDHLRPLVLNKKPTGYVSEIHNLVPACGKCNQSKGNKPWSDWMVSDAKLSPKSRGIKDIDIRLKRLADYEAWEQPTIVDFEAVVGKEKWEQHWANWELVQNTMKQAQVLATEINKSIAASYSLKN
ncbi:HNH endonuclease [Alteromonas sp. McT4-15]|uniref:HNH endonuclease n=1 Tax=Alteromonas sp. McT4-15 TaxID=2881256 RepID=UPI001CF80715|nr:HNH endonuclease [Alteromonas sp. McT4-15]MCB4436979.1 HNH endonuclease [Alteromonas sp. McT4-15]